ncbi:methyl-accepting chemotaxis protein [Arenibaculum pallidiluteum]|uniref:methyl-accepting chemotaxis protein n=1 Tax=Arenibaculum pallidiluteum TaxID=2812559 RepID=UPI001A97D340|nr:methyl-accepting chemotaxis protein [Arenibaculum pallidiluteum]
MPILRYFAANLMRRALAPLVIMLALIAAGLTLLIAEANMTRARQALEEKARLTVAIASESLQEALWNLSPDLAEGTLRALAADPDFLSVLITGEDGTVFARGGSETPGPGLSAKRDITHSEQGTAKRIGAIELWVSSARSEAAARTEALWTLCAGGVVLAMVASFLYLVLRSVIRPISRMTAAMIRLSGGELGTEIPALERTDEVGAMARAVQVFKDNAAAKQRLEAEHEAAARRTEEEKRLAMVALADGFEQAVGSLMDTVMAETSDMELQAQEMTRAADRTNKLAGTVAAATEQTSANVQTVAAASEELSGSIDEISRQVLDSSRIAGEAVGLAHKANDKVASLADTVQKIGAVVELINSIAGQTNLLALNATIEAARAGEAGKGFAVVASEVKALANQTAKATEEIAAQVAAVQSVTREAVTEIHGVAGVIERVNEIATTIASAVEEQGAATKEISRNVQQAAGGTQEVAANIAGVNEAAGESGKAAWAVLETSRKLSMQATTLNEEVSAFLRSVRAA